MTEEENKKFHETIDRRLNEVADENGNISFDDFKRLTIEFFGKSFNDFKRHTMESYGKFPDNSDAEIPNNLSASEDVEGPASSEKKTNVESEDLPF